MNRLYYIEMFSCFLLQDGSTPADLARESGYENLATYLDNVLATQ